MPPLPRPLPACQLEDDIVAKPNYLSTMKNFALQQPSEEWMILEFSQLGFIGRYLSCWTSLRGPPSSSPAPKPAPPTQPIQAPPTEDSSPSPALNLCPACLCLWLPGPQGF